MNEEYYYVVSEEAAPQTAELTDPKDPFGNETEFHDYQCDYGEVLPMIRIPGTRLPRLPGSKERSRIRRFHNIVGGFLAGHFLLSNVLAVFVILGFGMATRLVDTRLSGGALPADYDTLLEQYFNGSSSMLALNALIYGICNLLIALVGCKATRIPLPNLFRTKDLKPPMLFGYIGVVLLLQVVTGYLAEWITDLFDASGISLYTPDFAVNTQPRYIALSFCYSVIVAPITEELLMRGFVLKNLTRSNQHFGILMTGFLFGLWHENVAQFLLAFPVGCFLGYITVKHDSLVPAILCHMAVNLCAELGDDFDNFGLDAATTALSVVYIVMMLVGIGMLIYMLVTERFPRTTPAQAERGLRIMLTSPLMLLALVCHLGATTMYILSESGII